MNIKHILFIISQLLLLLGIILVVISTIRYVMNFYSGIHSLGDKALPVFYFLLIFAALLAVSSFLVWKIPRDRTQYRQLFQYVEVGVPVLTIIVNIFVTLLNSMKL